MTRFFATLVLVLSSVGTTLAAGGTYDDEDPFKERQRIAEFQALGGDVTKEVDLQFLFFFEDRPETREQHAHSFALKLRRSGYPDAQTKPCAGPTGCWIVTAPKRMRIDEKKLIALGKELDQLVADDYGRYRGWDNEIFYRDDEQMQALAKSLGAAPTVGELLEAFEQLGNLRCSRARAPMEREAEQASAAGKLYQAYATRRMLSMMCNCMPGRAREMREDLPPAERDARVTEDEFAQRYAIPGIVHQCAALMMRKIWGEDCPHLAPAYKVNDTYCPCMRQLVEGMSEAEIAQVGLASADYMPLAAQAAKEGKSPPPQPQTLKQFTERELACRK
jgi:hypothetical protein